MFSSRQFRYSVLGVDILTFLFLCVSNAYSQDGDPFDHDSNRGEVRAGISAGGWSVAWGKTIDEGEYARFMLAVASSATCECFTPLNKYFDNLLTENVRKFQSSAKDAGQDAMMNLLAQAFQSRGQVFRNGRLEVQAGIATYQRSKRVVYHEPSTSKKKVSYGFGWTYVPEVTMEKKERVIPLPNHHQPYIKFRVVSAPHNSSPHLTPSRPPVFPSNNSQGFPPPQTGRLHEVKIENATSFAVSYQLFRVGIGWESFVIQPGQGNSHTSSATDFRIQYDAFFAPGVQNEQHTQRPGYRHAFIQIPNGLRLKAI